MHETKTDWLRLAELHNFARQNDERVKERAQLNFNKYMRTKEAKIQKGDKVLFKLYRSQKSVSEWDPDPFVVVNIKGSMITARRTKPRAQVVTRNSSFFKIFHEELDDSLDPLLANYVSLEDKGKAQSQVRFNPVVQVSQPGSLSAFEYAAPAHGGEKFDIDVRNGKEAYNNVIEGDISEDVRASPFKIKKRGSKIKAESERLELEKKERSEAARMANPPERSSARLAAKQKGNGGKIMCL